MVLLALIILLALLIAPTLIIVSHLFDYACLGAFNNNVSTKKQL